MDGWPDYLLYLFPLLWIAAATIVALLLYKTSEALVEHRSGAEGDKKRVRLVGSVAIAVVIFFLLWKATPSLVGDPATVRLSPAGERSLNERRLALIQAWARYQACIDMPAVGKCPVEQDDMDQAVRRMDAEYRSALQKINAK